MEPEWSVWLQENMPSRLLKDYIGDRGHDLKWRDKRIADLESTLRGLETYGDGVGELHEALQHAVKRLNATKPAR